MWTRRRFLGAIGASVAAQPVNRPNVVLSNSSGFGGANVVLVLKSVNG